MMLRNVISRCSFVDVWVGGKSKVHGKGNEKPQGWFPLECARCCRRSNFYYFHLSRRVRLDFIPLIHFSHFLDL
jgi:hypothetical protein